MVAVVTAHDAPKNFEKTFETDRAVDDGEGAVAKGVAQASRAIAEARLRRPDHDGRRRLLEATEELEDARAGGLGTRRVGFHGNRHVDDRDVHRRAAEEFGGFDAGAAAVAVDAERSEDGGKLIGEVVLAPAAVGDH